MYCVVWFPIETHSMEWTPYQVTTTIVIIIIIIIISKIIMKGRKKETQQRGLRNRVYHPNLVPAIIPGPREQTYTTESRSLVGIRREGSTRVKV